MKHKNFAVFILSHGRAKTMKTIKMLDKYKYKGKIFIILDDEDTTINEYKELYGKRKNCKIIIFSKKEAESRCDFGDKLNKRGIVLFARNTCFKIARENNIEYFLELDDDYGIIQLRIPEDGKFKGISDVKDIDKLFDAYLDFLDCDSRIKCIAMSQGGDYIGGENGYFHKGLSRKVMNSFFCKTDREWKFFGRINEDATAYSYYNSIGELFFSYTKSGIVQGETQQNKGGLTEFYLDTGTYYKSFMTVRWVPSAVKVAVLRDREAARLHHRIEWNNIAPKILNEKYKKK